MFEFAVMFSRVRLRVDEPNATDFDTITARPTFVDYNEEEKGERCCGLAKIYLLP